MPYLLTTKVDILGVYLYKTAFAFNDTGKAAAISVVLFVIIFAVILLTRKRSKPQWQQINAFWAHRFYLGLAVFLIITLFRFCDVDDVIQKRERGDLLHPTISAAGVDATALHRHL